MKFDDYSNEDFIEIYDGLTQDYVLTSDEGKELSKAMSNLYQSDDDTYYKALDNVDNKNDKSEYTNKNFYSEEEDDVMTSAQPFRPPTPRPPRPPMQSRPPMQRPPSQTMPRSPMQPRPSMPRPPRPPYVIPIPVPPVVPLPPIARSPSNSRAVRLSAEIYRQIISLEDTYQSLIMLANRQQVKEIEGLSNEINSLSLPAQNIYKALSKRDLPAFKGSIYDPLPNNYCIALRVTFNRVSNLYDDVLSLQRIVNIPVIDRQLIIMASVLQRHLSTFNRLLIDCLI